MLPATFCAGTTLPLITFHLMKRGHGEASIGAVYAANTVGAIAGVFFAVHAGLPLLGLKGLLTLGGALDIGLGAVLLWTAAAGFTDRRVPRVLSAAGGAVVALAFLLPGLDRDKMASGVYCDTLHPISPGSDRVMFHRDGKTATVSVVEQEVVRHRGIRTNGKTDAEMTIDPREPPTADEPTMALLGALPMALHPQARRAELDAIWQSIASACGGHLSPREREWLAFFQATGRRDGPGMAIEARRLLAGDRFLTPALQRYLVAAGMLGSIAAGNRMEAQDLWSQHGSSIGAADDLLSQVVVEQSRGE